MVRRAAKENLPVAKPAKSFGGITIPKVLAAFATANANATLKLKLDKPLLVFVVPQSGSSRGVFAKMCPPPRRIPLRREPARALPVPFWRYILAVEPATSDRVFVFADPCLAFAWYPDVGYYAQHHTDILPAREYR